VGPSSDFKKSSMHSIGRRDNMASIILSSEAESTEEYARQDESDAAHYQAAAVIRQRRRVAGSHQVSSYNIRNMCCLLGAVKKPERKFSKVLARSIKDCPLQPESERSSPTKAFVRSFVLRLIGRPPESSLCRFEGLR
jgi:hypothetical protein